MALLVPEPFSIELDGLSIFVDRDDSPQFREHDAERLRAAALESYNPAACSYMGCGTGYPGTSMRRQGVADVRRLTLIPGRSILPREPYGSTWRRSR